MSKPLAQFSYDIWGDRVNIASRLQTHELPNAVHVSEPMEKTLSWAEGEMEGYMRT
jgi:class 3 adenylate cyclase